MFKRKKEKSQYSEIERIKNNSQDNDMLSSTIMFDFSIIFKIAIGLLIIFVLIHLYKDSDGFVKVSKEYEYVESLKNIKKPKHNPETGGTTIVVDGENIEVTYLASVDISGRVSIMQKCFEHNLQNKISPIDLIISWGDLAKNKNSNLVNWSEAGERGYQYYISAEAMQENPQLINIVKSSHAHLSLVPANKEIKSLIKMIKQDDYIRMEGFVVSLNCEKKNGGTFRWHSGYSKSNFAGGKSKLFLVTKIVWLEANGS